jgi:hypothetical protein
MPRPPITEQKPKFFFSPARQYLQLLSIAQRQTPRIPENEFHLAFPKRMLLGFALELYLKAWLRIKGVSTGDLRYVYGHDIQKLFDEALALGLPARAELHDVVHQLAPQHADFGFRYVVDGSYYIAMDYRYVTWALCVLDEDIADQMPDVTVGHGIDIVTLPV